MHSIAGFQMSSVFLLRAELRLRLLARVFRWVDYPGFLSDCLAHHSKDLLVIAGSPYRSFCFSILCWLGIRLFRWSLSADASACECGFLGSCGTRKAGEMNGWLIYFLESILLLAECSQ